MRPFITSDINPTTMSHALARQCSSALFHVPSGQVPLVMGTSSTPEKPSGSSPHSAATKENVMHCGEIKADNLYVSHPDKRIEVKNCCSMFSFYKRRQLLQRQADIKQGDNTLLKASMLEGSVLLSKLSLWLWRILVRCPTQQPLLQYVQNIQHHQSGC